MRDSKENVEDTMPTGMKNVKITQELSEGNEHSVENCDRDHSCYAVKTLSAFWPRPKILYKINFKKKKFQCI